MTKKLEELFDLPAIDGDEDTEPAFPVSPSLMENLEEKISQLKEFEPMFESTDSSSKEMDEIAETAISAYKDIMDLGMNVEAKFCAPLFEVAQKMLGHAMNAKSKKIEKQLKAFELQFKKQSAKDFAKVQTRQLPSDTTPSGEVITGTVIDRNEYLKQLRESKLNGTQQ